MSHPSGGREGRGGGTSIKKTHICKNCQGVFNEKMVPFRVRFFIKKILPRVYIFQILVSNRLLISYGPIKGIRFSKNGPIGGMLYSLYKYLSYEGIFESNIGH